MSLGVARALGVELHDDVVQLVVAGEGAHLAAAEQRLERRRDVADRHAEVLGAVAIERSRPAPAC